MLGRAGSARTSGRSALWLQDSWHVSPNFTVSYGARYDLTFPFVALNNSYSIGDLDDVYGVSGVGNLFKPGTLTGQCAEFRQLGAGERAYPMDWNNISPSVGVAWTPTRDGWVPAPHHRRAPATSWFAPGTTDRTRASA